MGGVLLIVIVTAAGNDLQNVIYNTIHQSVRVINSTAPETAQIALERLRLANAIKTAPFNILYESVYSL